MFSVLTTPSSTSIENRWQRTPMMLTVVYIAMAHEHH